MKNKIRRSVLLLAVALGCITFTGNAQIFVKIRPERPHYERVVAPSPRHVWIDEEWEPRGGTYEFRGGRWAEPPYAGGVWITGHWAQKPRGWVWIRGHWRR